METIHTSDYSIFFKSGDASPLNLMVLEKKPSKIIIVTDSNTDIYCLPILLSQLQTPIPVITLSIPAGEENKNLYTCETVWASLSENKVDRKALIIMLGGGVVCDLGGFVASTFLRGIDFVHIPTTLLAMVDASIGGKTGIDLGILKNQIGLFSNPIMVWIDPQYLETLPKREFLSGMAEIFKHSLISSEDYLDDLLNWDIDSDEGDYILQSIKIKKQIVEEDPFESGMRKSLNFGHTLGHAIESYSLTTSNRLLHGESVAIGMVLALFISKELLGFPETKLKKIISGFNKYYKKVTFHKNAITEILDLLYFDKKNENGNVNFVLLKDIGQPVIDQKVDTSLLLKAFSYYEDEY